MSNSKAKTSSQQPAAPLISKEKFVEILDFLQTNADKFDTLVKAMEDLSPGFYVDFYANLPLLEKAIELLSLLMLEPFSSVTNDNLIEYYFFDLDCGRDKEKLAEPSLYINNKPITIKNAADLYDLLVELNFKANK